MKADKFMSSYPAYLPQYRAYRQGTAAAEHLAVSPFRLNDENDYLVAGALSHIAIRAENAET
jgi:hypothetical protein